jgi:hypothetical protein
MVKKDAGTLIMDTKQFYNLSTQAPESVNKIEIKQKTIVLKKKLARGASRSQMVPEF